MVPAKTPRYRYREEAPEVISVPAEELVERLPEELRGESGARVDKGLRIDLPCSEVLRGNVPRITLGRLGELASGLVRVPEGRDPSELINLPPGWIALHFRMVTRAEELPPEPLPEDTAPAADDAKPAEVVAPKGEAPVAKAEPEPATATPEGSGGQEGEGAVIGEESPKKSATPAKEQSASPKKGFFSSLPIFRRTEVSDKTAAPATEGDSPTPAGTLGSAEGSAQSLKTSPVPRGGKELASLPPVLERLWKLDPQDELADGSALQALFMTDEKLTLEKVVSKAGELPGLDACVLAHGDRVICASKSPSGTDLQTLSGQAMTMLSQIRNSSEKMGLGAVPAVTLHADKGVVSFLHRGELCLLVIHADRGFVPGVRERLQEMLVHLSASRPALPPASGS